MADLQLNGSAHPRVDENNEKQSFPVAVPGMEAAVPSPAAPANYSHAQLEAAALEAGQHPERAAEIATGLGIGTFSQHSGYSSDPDSPLRQAMRGVNFPTPIHDRHFEPPPAGAFDAGVARVFGEQYVADFAEWVRNRGMQIMDPFEDETEKLREQVQNSFGFARFACFLVSGIRLAYEDGDKDEAWRESAANDLSRMAAVSFLAGWMMGCEHEWTVLGGRPRASAVEAETR